MERQSSHYAVSIMAVSLMNVAHFAPVAFLDLSPPDEHRPIV